MEKNRAKHLTIEDEHDILKEVAVFQPLFLRICNQPRSTQPAGGNTFKYKGDLHLMEFAHILQIIALVVDIAHKICSLPPVRAFSHALQELFRKHGPPDSHDSSLHT